MVWEKYTPIKPIGKSENYQKAQSDLINMPTTRY